MGAENGYTVVYDAALKVCGVCVHECESVFVRRHIFQC